MRYPIIPATFSWPIHLGHCHRGSLPLFSLYSSWFKDRRNRPPLERDESLIVSGGLARNAARDPHTAAAATSTTEHDVSSNFWAGRGTWGTVKVEPNQSERQKSPNEPILPWTNYQKSLASSTSAVQNIPSLPFVHRRSNFSVGLTAGGQVNPQPGRLHAPTKT